MARMSQPESAKFWKRLLTVPSILNPRRRRQFRGNEGYRTLEIHKHGLYSITSIDKAWHKTLPIAETSTNRKLRTEAIKLSTLQAFCEIFILSVEHFTRSTVHRLRPPRVPSTTVRSRALQNKLGHLALFQD